MTTSTTAPVRDVIIIGSGPAGYAAAVYAARARLEPLVFEGSVTAGGALMNTTDVENYPGFTGGIMGPALMEQMRSQAERFGAVLVADDALEVDLTGGVKVVKDSAGTEHRAKAVILAMGSAYRKLGLPGEDRLSGHGVSWCATCDGFFFRDQEIAVAGGGDSAMEEAIFLTRFAKKVTVLVRRDRLRASKIMADRAVANERIEFAWNSEVAAIHGGDKLSGVTVRDTMSGATRELEVTGLFIAIGHDPRSELVTGQVNIDREGYVLVDQPSTKTNLPGAFAAGDLVDHTYRQAVTAAGTGCAAALDAERYLAALHRASGTGSRGSKGSAGADQAVAAEQFEWDRRVILPMGSGQAEGLRIEFLYDPDCPSHEAALARLRDILDDHDPTAEVVVEAILSQEQVQRRRFIGSPTIRVNGADIDPASEHLQDYALACRAYVKPDGRITPLPPREMIREALLRARTGATKN